MTLSFTQPEHLFNIWNPEHLVQLPKLRATIDRITMQMRNDVSFMAEEFGPMKVKLLHHRRNKFKDMLFDWLYEPRSDREENHYDEAGNLVYDADATYQPLEFWTADVSEFKETFGEHQEQRLHTSYDGSKSLVHNYWNVNEQITTYLAYQLNRLLLDHSEPVRELKNMGAQFSYQHHFDTPLLVVDDPKIGLVLKLKY